ncbi:aminopeptidase [Thiospirochaeta perfilievii]|uniref:Aminopeptidase n=1 Tax=Thiospirochaeta perfilievii TaxID=252967 RepID=A0A5C1Q9E1_9SPIO|nr:aminopeptidase [Thiospirochaeta perfilievii]QEN03710.1 aminopeptidase [Thiospirochaeta perfilievii]
MRSNEEKYAELLVNIGVNIQKNQTLVINCPVECAHFARVVTIKAYEAGAREVLVNWNDEKLTKIRYNMANDEVFDEVYDWETNFFNTTADMDAAYLRISASDPQIMKDVDPKKISRQNKVKTNALKYYRSKLMSNQNVWCVASIPTIPWAKKVFPGCKNNQEAVNKLWDAIFKAVRVDLDDPIKAWEEHQHRLREKLNFMNSNSFKYLKYKNSIGTDVTVELVQNHIWAGGGEESSKGQYFIANMPTEEIFTMPKLDGVNGKIVSSIPLNYNGNLIEDFSFTFKDGTVVDFDAKKGYDVLKELLDTDNGAKRLGEVALVPYDSPISNQKILFFNTLFDENASCHFALGKAYPINIKGGTTMSPSELQSAGGNDSLVHVDFMVGTDDLEIIGIKENGDKVPVFKNGNFA